MNNEQFLQSSKSSRLPRFFSFPVNAPEGSRATHTFWPTYTLIMKDVQAIHVGKYTVRPMDPMGIGLWCFFWNDLFKMLRKLVRYIPFTDRSMPSEFHVPQQACQKPLPALWIEVLQPHL